jgi:hypothetical protein
MHPAHGETEKSTKRNPSTPGLGVEVKIGQWRIISVNFTSTVELSDRPG